MTFQAAGATTQEAIAWGALATGVAALVALIVGITSLIQKSRADRRAEWWRRTEWAIGQTNINLAPARESGLIVLKHQLESSLATNAERRLLREVALNIVRNAR